jgi:PAS domain S-box-containing protein
LRYGLSAAYGYSQFFSLLYLTILLVALLAGFGPGLFATLLSAVLADYLFIEPVGSLQIRYPYDAVGLASFIAVGTVISVFGGLTRRHVIRIREFERIVQGLEEMVAVVNHDYACVAANQAYLNYWGAKEKQVIGGRFLKTLDPEVFEATVKGRLDECFRGKVMQCELRHRHSSLSEKVLLISCYPIEGPGGVDRAACVLRDATEKNQAAEVLRASEAELREAQRVGKTGSWYWNLKTGEVIWTDQFRQIFNIEPSEPARPIRELHEYLAPQVCEEIEHGTQMLVRTGKPSEIEAEFHRPDGTAGWVLIHREADRDEAGDVVGIRGTILDITERKRATEALRRSNRELKAVSSCNQALLRAVDEQNLLSDICRIVCEEAGHRMAWVGYAEHDEAKTVRPVAWAGAEDGYLTAANITWADTEKGRGPGGTSIRTGVTRFCRDMAEDPQVLPWREAALVRGYRSSIALPLKDETGTPFGALSIYAAEPDAFTAEEIRLLEELTGDLSFGITNLRARTMVKRAEQERAANLRFFESMDKVNRAMQGTKDLEETMNDVLDEVLSIFDCDRAYLLYPCDPEAKTWTAPIERTRPEYPGVPTTVGFMPMDEEVAQTLRILLSSDGPVKFGPEAAHPLPGSVAKQFHIQSFMSMALHPKTGMPWQFGIHSCSHPRAWTDEETKLLDAIGRRLTDALSSLLAHRDLQESESKLAEAERIAHVGYWDYDMVADRIEWSGETCRIYGLELEERVITRGRLQELVPPEDWPLVEETLAEVNRGGPYQTEHRVRRPGGEVRFIHAHGDVVRDDSGRPIRMFGTVQDITERKQAEEALRASEAELREAQRVGKMGSWYQNLKTKEVIWSEEFCHIFGLEPSEPARPVYKLDGFLKPEVCERLERGTELLVRTGKRDELEAEFRRRDGTTGWVLIHREADRDEDGNVVGIRGVVRDITERKRAEAEWAITFDTVSDPIMLLDKEYRVVRANRATTELLGLTLEQTTGRPCYELIHQRSSPPEGCPLVRMWETGCEARGDVEEPRLGRVFDVVATPVRDVGRQLTGCVHTIRDITWRKQAEETLRHSEERFRVALKESPVSVFIQDRELRYTWIFNPQFYMGQDVRGKTDEELLGREEARRMTELKRQVLQTGASVREEAVITRDNRKYSFEVTLEPLRDAKGEVVGITGAAMDIARMRELADGLKEAKDKLVQEKRYLENEIREDLGFKEIVGQSAALQEVLKQTRVVAPTDSSVLLLGETGTGKELVARAIHSLSARKDKNFIKLNCAAVPTGLLESELFGHEKGAFTSAVSQKGGRLELADKGTLFLDEIGELPLELQPKLLRVLQDREFERLGGVRTLRVDVRIISATNRDIRKDIAEKKFREDLFYRLNVFPIPLPALRDRRTDIPLLVHHFVQKHATRMGKHIENIPVETMSMLQNWSWPGNIRELENMIERMVIFTKGEVLAPPPRELNVPQDLSGESLTGIEREHIIRVLHETNGVLSGAQGAASRLGVKRTTLQSMLKRFGIEPQEFRRGTGTFGKE